MTQAITNPIIDQYDHQKLPQSSTSGDVKSLTPQTNMDTVLVPKNIFDRDITSPITKYPLPEVDSRINNTPQLVYCLSLLQPSLVSTDQLDEIENKWIQARATDLVERKRLQALATDLIREFVREEFKKPDVVAEVVSLAPVLDQDDFRSLLKVFVDGIDHSVLLKLHLLDGLARLVSNAPHGYIDSDDMVKILERLNERLKDTHEQSIEHLYRLSATISHVLDGMVDSQVKGLKREQLHEPLSDYLKRLQTSSDLSLVYQAAYAQQALQHVPDDETILQSMLRRTGKVIKGISGMVSAVRAVDINRFMDSLQTIQDGLATTKDTVVFLKDVYQDVKTLAKGGQDLLKNLQEGFSLSRKSAWYPALRVLDRLLLEGKLVEFDRLIREAPCRHDAAFQLGVCQRLGNLAVNIIWAVSTRQCAVSFLGELYRDDVTWQKESDIKQQILSTFLYLTRSPDIMISSHALDVSRELEIISTTTKQDSLVNKREFLYQDLSPPQSSQLLDRIQNIPGVEVSLQQLRRNRLKERSMDVYISPRAKANNQATEDFDLRSKVQEFLDSNKEVFLLLGDSGAGKSTFNRALETSLWDDYKAGGRIPLFIHLPTIDRLEHGMVEEHLSRNGFTEELILELKIHREFILICDGYDECQTIRNLYMSNQLNQTGQWRAQMVISCRTEHIGVDYLDQFRPTDRNIRAKSNLFQEMIVSPFNKDQIEDYVDQFVSIVKPQWKSADYLQALDQIPNLQDLVKNPFLLKISMDVLPRLVELGGDFSEAQLTRIDLYDEFLAHWIDRSKIRFGEIDLSPAEAIAFKIILNFGFKEYSTTYLKDLATAIYENQGGNPVIKYLEQQDLKTWKARFFNMRDENCLLQQSIPLIRNGGQYRFLHRSVLEHGLTLAIFDPSVQDNNIERPASSSPSRRGSTSSTLSHSSSSSRKDEDTVELPLLNSPLATKDFVRDKSILEFLIERAQQYPTFKDQLHAVIHRSKTDKKARVAAANAVTVLVKAGVPFHGTDLRRIKIPGADLSNGMFDSVQLEGADLRKVNLQNIWLRQADLSGAQMTGIQFGELPYLQEQSRVSTVAYSPNGEILAVGLASGDIILYETSNWGTMGVFKGHRLVVSSLAYSKTRNQIVSSSFDSTIRLWGVDSCECTIAFEGHDGKVSGVAYSPDEDRIVSGSEDKTVRIWNVETGICIHTLEGHSEGVFNVIYSPRGDQVASASEDKSVRLWDVGTGDCIHIIKCDLPIVPGDLNRPTEKYGNIFNGNLIMYSPKGDQIISSGTLMLWDVETGDCIHDFQGHSDMINCVVFSPTGDMMASGCWDGTARLWYIETVKCAHVLRGHSGPITKISFSPNGSQIASASHDYTIRLWDAETANCLQILHGHSIYITCIAYSPDGYHIVSGDFDRSVRLWSSQTKNIIQATQGHGDAVMSIRYSPEGDQIISAGFDGSLRLWDAETGCCTRTLQGHKTEANCVAYSPDGDQIVSGSGDKTVRLWDTRFGYCMDILDGHTDFVKSVAFSPTGNQVASGSNDKTIKIWDLESSECIRTLQGHSDDVESIAYSPNGDYIISGSRDHTLRLWDVETGECIHTLLGHSGFVNTVVYSPAGDQVASASDDKTVKLWDAKTGNCVQTIQEHRKQVVSVVYSPSGEQIATGSEDQTVRLLDLRSGRCLLVISGFTGAVNSIDWKDTPDGQYLLTGSGDKSVRHWRIIEKDGKHKAFLCWSSSNGGLTLSDAIIDDLGGVYRKLLTQRGAIISAPNPEKRE
ncbi:hypothetical protein BGZ46_006274 [Entomortierella lignicola]|nr:hypothetical protein BGZ46_006274 [Entomortierella lignicola]